MPPKNLIATQEADPDTKTDEGVTEPAPAGAWGGAEQAAATHTPAVTEPAPEPEPVIEAPAPAPAPAVNVIDTPEFKAAIAAAVEQARADIVAALASPAIAYDAPGVEYVEATVTKKGEGKISRGTRSELADDTYMRRDTIRIPYDTALILEDRGFVEID